MKRAQVQHDTIKTTGEELLAIDPVLAKIESGAKPAEMDTATWVKSCWRTAGFTRRLATEIRTVTRMRSAEIRKFGTGPDSNGAFRVLPVIDGQPNPKFLEFQDTVEALLSQPVEVEVFPLPLSVLEVAGSALTRGEVRLLAPFILDDGGAQKGEAG